MAFRFSLQSLLRVREIRERAELQTLQALAARTAAARAELERLAASAEGFRRELCRDAATGVFGAELQFQARREETLAQRRLDLLRRLAELQKAEQSQQARYRLARMQREALSTLRDAQLATYNLEESRRQQRALDELFLLRRGRDAAG